MSEVLTEAAAVASADDEQIPLDEVAADDEIPLDPDDDIKLDEEPAANDPVADESVDRLPLMDVLPADFPLPVLMRFVPDQRLRVAIEEATAYALSIEVVGEEGLARADVALTALRNALKAAVVHFQEPAQLADGLHKGITGTRGQWIDPGERAVRVLGQRVWAEDQRLKREEAERARKEQEEADRKAREDAKKETDAAVAAGAPAPVVQEMERRAATATAAPTPMRSFGGALRGNTTVSTWKSRLKGTLAEADPHPDMAEMTPVQIEQVKTLMRAVLDGKAEITCFELSWKKLDSRAKADKSTLNIPGVEAYEDGGIRGKGSRSR